MFLYNLRNVPFWHLVFTLWDISSKEKIRAIPGHISGKEPACQCRRRRVMGLIPSWEDVLEEGITTHSSILAWEIPWTEKPGGLQSMGSQRVGHNWSNLAHTIGNTKKNERERKSEAFLASYQITCSVYFLDFTFEMEQVDFELSPTWEES